MDPELQRCEVRYLRSPNFYTRAYISIVEYLKTMHNSDNYVIAAHCAEYTEADTGGEYVLFNLLTYKFFLLQ